MAKSDDVTSEEHRPEHAGTEAGPANAEPALPQSADLFRTLFLYLYRFCVSFGSQDLIIAVKCEQKFGYGSQQSRMLGQPSL